VFGLQFLQVEVLVLRGVDDVPAGVVILAGRLGRRPVGGDGGAELAGVGVLGGLVRGGRGGEAAVPDVRRVQLGAQVVQVLVERGRYDDRPAVAGDFHVL